MSHVAVVLAASWPWLAAAVALLALLVVLAFVARVRSRGEDSPVRERYVTCSDPHCACATDPARRHGPYLRRWSREKRGYIHLDKAGKRR